MEPRFEVVILAGGECKRLYPLTSGGVVKALLPVGNRPLISYPLRHLAEAGIKNAIVVRAPHRAAGLPFVRPRLPMVLGGAMMQQHCRGL